MPCESGVSMSYDEPKKVVVTTNVLNIRSTPATDYGIRGTVRMGDVLEIAEIKKVGTIYWGRLYNSKGWICLTYTEPVKERGENNGCTD